MTLCVNYSSLFSSLFSGELFYYVHFSFCYAIINKLFKSNQFFQQFFCSSIL